MDKKYFLITLSGMMAACGNPTANNQEHANALSESAEVTEVVETPDSEETIRERVIEIYSSDRNSSIYSASLNELMEKVNKLDEGAELGYFDHDLLTQAQDEVEIKEISISDITAQTATATIQTNYHPLTVKLVKENGSWKVDDVNNERSSMLEYIGNN